MVLLSSNHWLLAVEKKKERVYISLETGELWPQSCSDACTYHHRRRCLSFFFSQHHVAMPFADAEPPNQALRFCAHIHRRREKSKSDFRLLPSHRVLSFNQICSNEPTPNSIALSLSLFSRFNG